MTTHRQHDPQEALARADQQIAVASAVLMRANAARTRRAHLRALMLTELRRGHISAAIRILDDESWDA